MAAVASQIAAMKEMVAILERQAGGPEHAWLQIAYSPEEARDIIANNRLAMILGVEVDSLGNWRRFEDLHLIASQDPDAPRRLIAQLLDELHALGIRQITPVHMTNNAFGGTAIYMRLLDATNLVLTGRHYKVEDGWHTGVRYRLDLDGAGHPTETIGRMLALQGERLSPERGRQRRSLLHRLPVIKGLVQALERPAFTGGHVNAFGLTRYGVMLIEEMMARGMIIDIDHMSQKTTDLVLALAEGHDYPLICSHAWFRDLAFSADVQFDPEHPEAYGTSDMHKVAHEAGKRGDQIERIGRLGGVVAPILNQGDLAGLARALPEQARKIAAPCAGSSTAWAEAYLYAVEKMGGRGVAIGSDVNGAAGLPGPRFGTAAAHVTRGDTVREAQRRAQIDRQTAGVRYAEPLRDYRWFRFEESGRGAYDEDERTVWQALAQFEAGFDPDHPHASRRRCAGVQRHVLRWAPPPCKPVSRSLTTSPSGFWAGAEAVDTALPQGFREWPVEKQAAYLVRRGIGPTPADSPRLREWMQKITGVWDRWRAMAGPNPPLARCFAGPRRDFDINLDGMAHYGLLPDLLQDVRNIGLTHKDLAPLFRSAEDYVTMWERCREHARGRIAPGAGMIRAALPEQRSLT